MRAVVQRVTEAAVAVDGREIARIGRGLLVLLGIHQEDVEKDVVDLAGKIAGLRVFPGDDGKLDRSVVDITGEALVVSQFTLIADTRRGRRPSFVEAARPEKAEPFVDLFARTLAGLGVPVSTGKFGADMAVSLVNDGPLTIVFDTRQR